AGVLIVVSILWLLPSAGVNVLQPYQVKRLTTFTAPGSDPQGDTYNQHQAQIAVGAGGLTGRGVSGATQTNLDYLPESQTDFAFAAFAEQRGFLGVSVLLLLYLIFVNVGMTIGLAPVTGITLPFVSVGGSSMIASLVAIGLLQAIHVRG